MKWSFSCWEFFLCILFVTIFSITFKLMQENTPTVTRITTQRNLPDGPVVAAVTESDLKVTVEKELVSQVEEEDIEALLGTYVFFGFSSDL